MSNIIFLMDKTVYLVLITALTAQALQFAGLMNSPKSNQNNLEIEQRNLINLRYRRDTSTNSDTMERSQFIDMIFNRKKFFFKNNENNNKIIAKISSVNSGWKDRIQNAMIYVKLINKIPIKTLTAVNNLIQNSRPAIKKLRDFAVKRFEKTTTTKAPEIIENNNINKVEKRSPVYIREIKA